MKNRSTDFFFMGAISIVLGLGGIAYASDFHLPKTELIIKLIEITVVILEATNYWGIFILMALESACIPIPSEIVMPFAGFLVFKGIFDFWLVVIAGTLGNLVGSLIVYYLGLKYGRKIILSWGKYLLLNQKHLELAEYLFNKYHGIIVLVSRVLPAIRTVISLPAGIGKMDLKKFTIYTFIGSIPWNFLLTYLGFILGENWFLVFEILRKMDLPLVITIILLVIWFIIKDSKNKKH